ncbi:MAG: phenylacetate--CoA ligase family protein [Rhodospirillales bacterium]
MDVLVPRSSVSGVTWPGLPGRAGIIMLALQYQLRQSQWWPPDVVRQHQFRQLRALLSHACGTVPFYRDRLGEAGFAEDRRLTADTWARIPLLGRPEVQEAGTALLSTRVPAAHGKTYTLSTSGSTGRPVTVTGTAVAQAFWRAFTLRDHLWHRRDMTRKLAVIRAIGDGKATYPKGARARYWGPATASVFASGPSAVLDITTAVASQALWLERENPEYLLTYPSNLLQLARHCRERGMTLPGLRGIETFAEVLQPAVREACREAWDVPVVDMYSAQEVGYMALQCPDHEHYHVQAESALVEVLNDQEHPCRPGETGRVVVTPLHNFAMPLIRYEIGDFAEVGEPCSCGRGLPVLRRIVGRERNTLTLPSGDRIWPSFPAGMFLAIAPVRQVQLIQRRPDEIELKLAVDGTLSGDQEERLRQALNKRLGHPFAYRFTYVDEIPRSAGGKYEDFRVELES